MNNRTFQIIRFIFAAWVWRVFQFCQKCLPIKPSAPDALLLIAQISPQMHFIYSKLKYGNKLLFEKKHLKLMEKFSQPNTAPVQKVLASLIATQTGNTPLMEEQLHQVLVQTNPQWKNQTSLDSPADFPDFLLLGVLKCGTTTLNEQFKKHPDLANPFSKELFYWGESMCGYGLEWYRAAFLRKKPGASFHTYECTPNYFANPIAIEQISTYMPQKKFIVMLRNPATRARSSYYFFKKHGWVKATSFDEMVTLETSFLQNDLSMITSYHVQHLHHGLYDYWIQKWLEKIAKEQFLFIKFEQFISEPQKELKKISGFLGIKAFPSVPLLQSNPTQYPGSQEQDLPALQKLEEFYKKHNAKLTELIGSEFKW
ncbi:MAG TPA: sulfotransferase domain-containing protein [Anaerolineales bacterium]|nr:sulfotransferase domain-containing protein [Anaerolineales bacterium]